MGVVANYFVENAYHTDKCLVNPETNELIERLPSTAITLLKNGTLNRWLEFYVGGENSNNYIKLASTATNVLLDEAPDKILALLMEREGSFVDKDTRCFHKYLKSTYAKLKDHPEFIDILNIKSGFCSKFDYHGMIEYIDDLIVYTELLQDRKLPNFYSDDEIINIIQKMPMRSDILDLPIDGNGMNILLKFAEVVPNENNQENYNNAIKKLRTLEKLNLNQKDFMGISFFEKAMNSGNENLLKFICDYGKRIEYEPVLDVAFNKMSDSCKKIAKETDVRFVDIEEAIRCRSLEALDKLQFQLKSPFMNFSNLNKLMQKLLNDDSLNNENIAFRNKALDFFATYINKNVD